jgi:exodeoxyribonuclease-3
MLTAMVYNILEGGLGYGADRMSRIIEVVRAAHPDVLVVCEANGFERDGHKRLYAFEHETGMRGVVALAPTGFHVAVFARGGRFIEAKPLPGFYHAALRLDLELGGERLRVVGAHLCPFSPSTRLLEAEILANEARDDEATLLMGDLNSLSPLDDHEGLLASLTPRRRTRHACVSAEPASEGEPKLSVDTRALGVLAAAGFSDTGRSSRPRATYPTALRAEPGKPGMRIDYVLASPPLAQRLEGAEVPDHGAVETASDHRPLVARFADG